MREKKVVVGVMVIFLSMLSHMAFGEDGVCKKKSGQTICQEGEVDLIKANGLLQTNRTKINKRVTIKGQAVLRNTQMNEMKVFGEAILFDTSVSGRSEVYGHLNSQKTQFKQPVTVWSNMMHASRSSFTDIIIASEEDSPRVILSDQTTVNGNIIFKGKEGRVEMVNGSRILGKIVNGKKL